MNVFHTNPVRRLSAIKERIHETVAAPGLAAAVPDIVPPFPRESRKYQRGSDDCGSHLIAYHVSGPDRLVLQAASVLANNTQSAKFAAVTARYCAQKRYETAS